MFFKKKNNPQPEISDQNTNTTGSVLEDIANMYVTQPDTNQLKIRKKIKKGSSRITKEKKTFLDNLALLVGSGMGVNTSLRTLHKNTQDKNLKKTLYSMLGSVESGSSLSQTMEEHNFLPDFLISLIKIGEESGNLADKIRRTVVSLDKDNRRRAQLRFRLVLSYFCPSLDRLLGSWSSNIYFT